MHYENGVSIMLCCYLQDSENSILACKNWHEPSEVF